jgi:hypothetical protein
MADERSGGNFERWMSLATTIVAPATVLSALLFYFGYVSSRAQYAYFGVDVDTIGLGTRDYVMRSPQPLLVPLLVLTLVGVAALRLHVFIGRRIAEATPGASGPARLARYLRLARRGEIAGFVVLAAGIILLLSYPYLRSWPLFNLVTPLMLAIGAAIVAYSSRIQTLLRPPVAEAAPQTELAPGTRAHAEHSMLALRRTASVLIFVVIIANIFWATATIAQWSGRGLAHYNATHLTDLPSVILDTKERLYLRDPGVEETALPEAADQTFHYRYRHLRLLIEGHDRMFLVPDKWSASDSTLVVPLDGSVRVQFQFVNDAP